MRKKLIAMRVTAWLPVALFGWIVLLATTVSTSQAVPFLSHGSVGEESVRITVRATPGDHCVLVWGVSGGRTVFELPRNLGGPVAVDIAPAWLFASTLDGVIALNAEGFWTFTIPSLPLIRLLVGHLHFQAVSFHRVGTRFESAVSNRLDLDISLPVSPRSNFEEAVRTLRAEGVRSASSCSLGRDRPSFLGERRVTTSRAMYRTDPLGNRIFEPRIALR